MKPYTYTVIIRVKAKTKELAEKKLKRLARNQYLVLENLKSVD